MNKRAIEKVDNYLHKAYKDISNAGSVIFADQLFETQKVEDWHSLYRDIDDLLNRLNITIDELKKYKDKTNVSKL